MQLTAYCKAALLWHWEKRFAVLTRKTWLIMRLTTIFLLAACLQVSARVTAQKVSITVKNVPLTQVLKSIEKQTGYTFVYSREDLQNINSVSVDLSNATIEEAMNACLKGQALTYTIVDKVIVIKSKPGKEPANDAYAPPAPPQELTGRVLNENGEPLNGAGVTLRRTGKGTITDAKGAFVLKDVVQGDTVMASFVGYASRGIKVTNSFYVEFILPLATNELDKVVIQAYGTTTQRLATGNIATITAAEIERQPVSNVLTALQGKVPGLILTQNSGHTAAPFKVEIRGRSVIDPSRPSEPLYVIDGVPLTVLNAGLGGNYDGGSTGFLQNGLVGPANGQSPLFSINPDDIETVTVLKDADATAIYGSRGANGVILITTKSGKASKANFGVRAEQGIDIVTNHYQMLDLSQYLDMRREAFRNDGIDYTDPGNEGIAYDLVTWDTTRYTDWQKVLWGGRAGQATEFSGALSGGDKQTTFRVSGTYDKFVSILDRSGSSQRGSVQSSLSHKSLNQRLSVTFTNLFSFAAVNDIPTPGAVILPPDAPAAYTKSGAINWNDWYPSGNPFGPALSPYNAKTSFLNASLSVQYQLAKGLDISTKLGYSTTHNSQYFLEPIASLDPINVPTGSAQFGSNNNSNVIFEPQLEHTRTIGKGTLKLLVGASIQSVSQDGNLIRGSGYLNDNLLHSIGNAPTRTASDINGQYRYAAVFGRINYNWENKYLLNMSARRDGSSRFGPGNQFGNFGALGAAWIFTEENWMKRLHFLSYGKLRGSYGLTGSDNIGDYNYLSAWSSAGSSVYIQNGFAYTPQRHANPDLQWQVNKKLEAALNLGFLHDRVTAELAWYRVRCGNQLLITPLPAATGFANVVQNLPATVQNEGIEATLWTKIVDRKDFEWSFNFNIGAGKNKLIAFPNLDQSPYASTFVIGQSLSARKLLHYTGVDPATGEYSFEDRNHDGVINRNANDTANDLYLKDLAVKFDGGFGMDLKYKNWQLNFFFRFRNQIVPNALVTLSAPPGSFQNYPVEVMNRWQKPGDKAQYARFTTQPTDLDYDFTSYSDGAFTSGSYIRLQNVSLSYDINSTWLKKIRMNSCRVYLHAENLLLITKYKGIDPDVPSFGELPPSRTIIAGIQFNL